LKWLTPEEGARADRFRFERDRRLYLTSRVMLRSLLSQYADATPDSWRFETNAFGKPRVADPFGPVPEFSLSHTHGLVCCAFSRTGVVGVDAESLDRVLDVPAVVERYCSPGEQRDLASLTDRDQQVRFLSYWTLKESLSKAIGHGLSMDVSRLSFQIDAERIQVAFDRIAEEPSSWSFGLFQPVCGYAIGVSVRTPSMAAGQISLRETNLESLQCTN
jgi:4'-phosphopantetheinyl transferase